MKKFIERLKQGIVLEKISISSKITLMCLVEMITIGIIAFLCVKWIGLFNFYAGVEKDIEMAARSVVYQASQTSRHGAPIHWRTICENIRSSLGVKMQVVDSSGNIIYNGFIDPAKGQDVPNLDELHRMIENPVDAVDYYPSSGMMIFRYNRALLFVNIIQVEKVGGRSYEICLVRRTSPQWLIYNISNRLAIIGMALLILVFAFLSYLWSKYYVFNDFREIVRAVKERENMPWKSITPMPVPNSYDERTIITESMNHLLMNIVNENKKQNDLLLAVAHDMKTPLSTLKMAVQGMKMEEEMKRKMKIEMAEEDEPNEFIDMASREIDFLEKHINIINKFIQQPAIDSSAYEYVEFSVFLYDYVLLPERNIWEKKSGRKIGFEGQVAHGTGYIAKDFVISMLRNIIQNAARFSDEETGRILISSQITSGSNTIKIAVRDNGIGIPPEKKDRIFEPGYKVDEARTRDTEDNSVGHGFGLSVAKKWADLLGISIYVDSELGKGTTVTVVIPILQTLPEQ